MLLIASRWSGCRPVMYEVVGCSIGDLRAPDNEIWSEEVVAEVPTWPDPPGTKYTEAALLAAARLAGHAEAIRQGIARVMERYARWSRIE